MTIADKLQLLGITLPEPKTPVGLYVNALEVENRLLFSGHGPWVDGKPITGCVGAELSVADGAAAARQVGLGILASVEASVGLDRIARLVRVFGMVRCTADFEEHPAVMNGFSQLMIDLFGPESGLSIRSAVGQISLPRGIAVEVEGEFLLKPKRKRFVFLP